MSSRFYLGKILVDQDNLTLTSEQGEAVTLQLKPIEVLAFLASRYPELVTREALIDNVWAGNAYVGEKALTNAIWQLRNQFQQLGAADCIATVRKKGYRLDLAPLYVETLPAELQPVTEAPLLAESETVQLPPARRVGAGFWSVMASCLLLIIAAWHYWPTQDIAAPELQITALTHGNGRATFPALSKDGRWLAFSWQQYEQPAQLYLADLAQPGSFKQLTFSEQNTGAAVWSPDNRYLYYSSLTPVQGRCSINRLTLQTLGTEVLTSCSRHSRVYLDIAPDGSYLLFSGSHNSDGSSLYRLDLKPQVEAPVAVPCRQHCEARVRDLAFSADGTRLLLTRRLHRLSEELFLRDLTTGDEQQLTFGEEDILGVSWHPDDRRIVYSALQHGRRQGFVLDPTNGSVRNLGVDDFGGQSQAATDGSIFFHRLTSATQLAYLSLAQQSGSSFFPLTSSDHRYEHPDFNAHNNALVFISNASGYTELWMASPTMQNPRQLTSLKGRVKYPKWSHQGDKVAFVARFPDEERDTLTILDVATGQLTSLETELFWHSRPSWWQDDSAILFSANSNLFKLDLSDLQLRQLTSDGGVFAQMTSDGNLLFTKGRNLGLWQLLPDGSQQQILDGQQFNTSYAWYVDQEQLLFLHEQAGQLMLRSFDWRTRQLTDRVQLSAKQVSIHSNLSYAAGPQRAFLAIDQQSRADIMQLRHPLLQLK